MAPSFVPCFPTFQKGQASCLASVLCMSHICFGISKTVTTVDAGVNVKLLMLLFEPISKDVFQVLIAANHLLGI